MRIRFRYVALVSAIILIPLAYITGETVEAGIAFWAGVVLGFLLDCIGVGKFNFWKYPRQKFLSKEYFELVVPAWGVFGMTINLLWQWFDTPIAFIAITAGLIVIYELPNLISKSWEYYTNKYAVVGGWFPLILSFRAVFLILPVEFINVFVRSML